MSKAREERAGGIGGLGRRIAGVAAGEHFRPESRARLGMTRPPRPASPDRAWPRRASLARALAAAVLLVSCATAVRGQGAPLTVAPPLVDTLVRSGLDFPTAVRFAPDGRMYVAEASGIIRVFPSADSGGGAVFADLRTPVEYFTNRALLSMAIDPQFPARPYIYAFYSYDGDDQHPAPYWNDSCPDSLTYNCPAQARVVRLTASPDGSVMTGETVLLQAWCMETTSHSGGEVVIGPDGFLYVSGGDGMYSRISAPADFARVHCPGADDNGSLAAQDLRTRTPGSSVDLLGSIIRIDPDTGAAAPGNPLEADPDPRAARIIAEGLRNPFRMQFRPGTSELWVGDVGLSTVEEINIIDVSTPSFANFGWPCYEGGFSHPLYTNTATCTGLPLASTTPPFYSYAHAQTMPGCNAVSGSITMGDFIAGGSWPAGWQGGLIFGDNRRSCLWAMLPSSPGGPPNPSQVVAVLSGASIPTSITRDPDGNIYYANGLNGTIHRLSHGGANQSPLASFTATPPSGDAPLAVAFDATGSLDADGTIVSYSWDVNGDGTFGDAAGATTSFTYTTPGTRTAGLRITDNGGASSATTREIAVTDPNAPPSRTFGNSSVGALSLSPGSGYKFGSVFTLAESGTTTSFRWYVRGGGAAQRFVPVVYAVNAQDDPAALLAAGADVTIAAGQAPGWVSSGLPSVPLAPGRYLLGLLSGPASSGAFNYGDAAGGAGVYNADDYPAPSNPFGGATRENVRWSFVLVYSPASGGPGPANTSPPTIDGNAQQGQTLTGSPGTWTSSPSFSYHWRRCDGTGGACADIAGAEATDYTLVQDDVGSTIRFAVTATSGGTSTTAVSAPTAVVTAPPPPSGGGTFGNASIGVLSLSPGSGYKFGSVFTLAESGTASSFRWYARGGGAAQRFVPVVYAVNAQGDPAALVAAGAEVTIAAGQAPGWVSSALSSVPLAPGRYLLGLLSGPASNGAFNYGEAAGGAGIYNADDYPAPSNPFGGGSRENVRWSFVLVYAAASGGPGPANTSPPTIGGSPQQGQTLTGFPGSWTGAVSFTYRWRRCDASGGACADIAGAEATAYTLVQNDVGATIRFAVTATSGGTSITAVSEATAVVMAQPPQGSGSTLGNTSIGGLSISPASGYKFGSVFTLGESGTATSFRWYVRGGSAAQKFIPVVYGADVSGIPTTLAGAGSEVTIAAGQAPGWVSSVLPSLPLTPGKYLLGLVSGPASSGAFNYAASEPNAGVWNASAYPSPSSSWGSVNLEGTRWSFYLTYTPTSPQNPATGTFGTTSIGSLSSSPGAGYKFGSVSTLTQAATAASLSFHARGGAAAQRFTPVVYAADASGNPTSLVASGAETIVAAGQAPGWITVPLPSVSLAAGNYLLGLLSGPSSGGAFTYYDPVPASGIYNANSYPSPSVAWGAINLEARRLSISLSYTIP